MKKSSVLKATLVAVALSASAAMAQDVSINVIAQEDGANDGSWAKDAPAGTVTVLVSICNNDGGSTNVPSYKLRPLISVPPTLVKVASADKQTGLPTGWTILTLNDGSIRLSNGNDQIQPADCREFPIYLEPIEVGGPLTITATMGFSNGNAPGSVVGPQTPGNNPANDNGTTTVQITAALPVTLVRFNAVKEAVVSQLTWATSEESNSDRFEVQRSVDGKNWVQIGRVASNGESKVLREYRYTDTAPVRGVNLYRLRMVDKDETFSLSSIKTVRFEGAGEVAYLYPNPSVEKVYLNTPNLSSVQQVSVIDMTGRSVMTTKAVATGIDVKTLSAGAYLLKVSHVDGTSSMHKFVINR